ncbi:copper radical oxidase [Cadophora sp. DSE1049]|nr:copper radical oxidase [Cadophora sp. DSE1049]
MAPSIVQVAFSLLFAGSAFASSDVAYAPLENRYAAVLDKRVIPTTLPGTWAYQGCYSEGANRALGGQMYANATGMTTESCIAFCDSKGAYFAGTEYSSECYCGNKIDSTSLLSPATDCSMTCSGNSTQTCGGPARLSVFWNGNNPPPGPSTNPGTGGYGFFGCYTEGTTGRCLLNPVAVTGGMTVGLCVQACKTAGYSMAGIEYASECWCGNAISNGALVAPGGISECNMLCNGNSSEYCGAGDRLDVYKLGYEGVSSSSVASSTRSSSTSRPVTVVSTTSRSSTSTRVSTSSTRSSSSTRASTSSTRSSTSTRASTSSTRSSSSTRASTSSTRSSSSTRVSTSSTRSSSTSRASSTSSRSSTVSSTRVSSSSSRVSSSTAATASSTVLAIKPVVGAYGFQGCYTEGVGVRALSGATFVDYVGMTLEICASKCAGTTYFGVEYGGECYCGNTLDATSVLAANQLDCSFTCPGDQYEYCGAGNRLQLYKIGSAASSSSVSVSTGSRSSTSTRVSTTSSPSSTAGPAGYIYYGCQTEGTGVRALSSAASASDLMTIEMCQASCAAYTYFGVEYGRECYCGNSLAASSVAAPATDCNVPCMGNTAQKCGAGNRLDVYVKNGTAVPTKPTGSSTAVSTSTSTPLASGLPTGWVSDGCYREGTTGRALQNQQPDSQANSVQVCINTCKNLGYKVAGMEYGTQCFCDNFLYNGAAPVAATSCNMPCPGNPSQTCGAGDFLNVYHTGNLTTYKAPESQSTDLPGQWVYQGCYSDNVNDNRALFWQSILTTNNSATTCLGLCQKYGFMAAGMEYGDECFCGDESVRAASGSVKVAEAECQVKCSGDNNYYCGGGSRLSYYRWIGGEPLNVWAEPTGIAAGSYEFLIGGVVVPLITTTGINNKVVFMEKSGTGAPNTTGTYELDLSVLDDFSKAWRPLHVKSDIFCSAGITLPDKKGRQLNIGGWAGPSTYGVRLYTPDGSDGVWGTNDWQENVNEVTLLEGRWYPSAMVMANGSVLVLGGEVGSNSAPTPSCEILPPPAGGYAKYLDWLDRTDPDNLYPFMFVLPSGGIFVVYYNEARIIDEKTFDTVKTLPNMPGSVVNFLAGRTYPLEGTGVMLPQYPPYSAPVTVLVCGGSANGAAYAIDNCVSTQPEVAAPEWTIERMPSQRVLSCICALPDGTYLILNGAKEGVAGFGLAQDPNYNAVLYDPSKPVNQRMSIMATTIVARLYHSEAILLPDGRVLVSGSNPEDGVHPEEYRVEVFNPPYALTAAAAPSFTINNKDWAYGAAIPITAKIPSGAFGTVKASMMAAVSSTHGNSMGQRTLFLTITCTGAPATAACTLTAPPSAHVAPPGWYQIFVLDNGKPSKSNWIRIGGAIADAANLGNWPNTASFTAPGLGAVGT